MADLCPTSPLVRKARESRCLLEEPEVQAAPDVFTLPATAGMIHPTTGAAIDPEPSACAYEASTDVK